MGYTRRNIAAELICGQVLHERDEQDEKWGEQNHPDVHPLIPADHQYRDYARQAHYWKSANEWATTRKAESWDGILLEEVYEALAESDPAKLRAELIQVAAVAVSWVEAIDRRIRKPRTGYFFKNSHTGKTVESE